MIVEILSWAFILAGSAILLIGSIGLWRLPDFYSRAHAAGMTDTMGAGLVILGMMVEAGWSLNLARLGFIVVFLFFTSPTASHALAHSALFSGLKPWMRPTDDAPQAPDAGAEQ
jgi:multicomponent Na+:H+ antiporter subunit G